MSPARYMPWLALLAAVLVSACQKRQPEPPESVEAAPAPASPGLPPAAASDRARLATPPPVAALETEYPAPPPEQLIAAYTATTDIPERVEIIHALAEAGAPGLNALDRLFQLETDSMLKITVLAMADTFDEGHLDARLRLLRAALAKDQAEEVRENALGILLSITDPRAVPLWQSLERDADATTREIAGEQIELLRDFDVE